MVSDYREITRWGKIPAWWLFHPDMNADRLCILAALTTYSDDRGLCSPSQSTLAKRLKRSRPWVNRVLAELVEIGLIIKRPRYRDNGGATSCEYVVRFQSKGSTAPSPVTARTAPCPAPDTPCSPGDTNQVDTEQNQNARADAREQDFPIQSEESISEFPTGQAQAKEGSDRQYKTDNKTAPALDRQLPQAPERDWHPSDEVIEQARKLFPHADIKTHIALFISKVRGKGYCIDPSRMDDAWLSWFIEDHRDTPTSDKSQSSALPPSASETNTFVSQRHGHRGHSSPKAHRFDRFSAWAEAAMS